MLLAVRISSYGSTWEGWRALKKLELHSAIASCNSYASFVLSKLPACIHNSIERFSFECRKVIGFALSTRCDWLKRFAPPFHPIRSKTKANCDALARFSRALRQPHVITSSFDWFNVLSVSYVIGQSNYFGFGFTTLKRKPLYTHAKHEQILKLIARHVQQNRAQSRLLTIC